MSGATRTPAEGPKVVETTQKSESSEAHSEPKGENADSFDRLEKLSRVYDLEFEDARVAFGFGRRVEAREPDAQRRLETPDRGGHVGGKSCVASGRELRV